MRLQRALPASDAFFLTQRSLYICYLDESGTVETGGNTEHFVLIGLAIPATTWKVKDEQVTEIKARFGLANSEIHSAWMARTFQEQKAVPNFAQLDWATRRRAVLGVRALNLGRAGRKSTAELIKNYRKTEAYVHLTHAERLDCLFQLAGLIKSWDDSRLFADAQWKRHAPKAGDHFSYAFEQVVTRFHTFLINSGDSLGMLVQDNNQTVARRLTEAMRTYHRKGTFFASINRIVETPLFVDSELTSIVQLADLCAFATRRYFDKNETALFEQIRPRFDRARGRLVGLRHYTAKHACRCDVCVDHGRI